jgi:hypothetical protein
MATLWQLFPNLSKPLESVKVFPISCRWTAPLIAGGFEFPRLENFAITGNFGEQLVLDGATLAADIDQLTFSQAIDPAFNNGVFSVDLIAQGNRHPVSLAPLKFSAFNQGEQFSLNFAVTATENNEERFNGQLFGRLIQTPALIALGKTSVTITLVANVYRIKRDALK